MTSTRAAESGEPTKPGHGHAHAMGTERDFMNLSPEARERLSTRFFTAAGVRAKFGVPRC